MTSAKIRLHDRRIMKMKSNTSLKSAVKIINNLRPLFLTQNVLLSFWISLFQNHGIYPYRRWKDSWRNMSILEAIFFFGGGGAPSTTSSNKLQRGCHTCWKKQTNNKNSHSTIITSLHLRKTRKYDDWHTASMIFKVSWAFFQLVKFHYPTETTE